MWDFGWYYRIALGGYGPPPVSGAQSAWPFFPLFPGVIRIGPELGIQVQWWTIVVNHVVLLVALLGVHRIVTATAGERSGRWAVWAVACFPGAFIFSMGYPSAIFLAASVWAFALAREGRDLPAGLCAAFAAMARPNGIVVAAALAAGLARAAPPGAGRRLPRRGRRRTGRPRRRRVDGLPLALDGRPVRLRQGQGGVGRDHGRRGRADAVDVAVAAPACSACWRSAPCGWAGGSSRGAWTLYAALYLLPPLALGVVGLARYSAECFVPFVVAGALLARWPRWVSAGLVTLSLAACAAYSVWVVRYLWVP